MQIQDLYELFLKSTGVTTDSRAIKGGEIFIALKGENFDGNAYALKALDAGAAYAVVDSLSEAAKSDDKRIIPVGDTLLTLQALARHHRNAILVDGKRLTVIGLTGTNGKTTTKELIRAVLAKKYNVTATEGNFNNDVGVPLSLLKITDKTQIAVIEMGANHPDDIAKLVKVSEPDYGLITNVGKAHLLGFGSFDGVKAAKGKLYDYIAMKGTAAFVNVDDPDLKGMAEERKGLSIIPYGIEAWGAMVLDSDSDHPFMRMAVPMNAGASDEPDENLLALESHLVGAYNAKNAMAAIAIGLFFGVELDDALQAVADYVPSNNRSQMMRTEKNLLVVDAYNANPTSMAAALDNFAALKAYKKVALLGNMKELGADSLKEHVAIIERLRSLRFSKVYLVGEEFQKAKKETGSRYKWFPTSAALADHLKGNPIEGAAVLVKGSRSTEMEKTIQSL